jgi:hypothetical protein
MTLTQVTSEFLLLDALKIIALDEPIPHSGIFHFYKLAKQDEVLSERACKNENIRNEVEDGSWLLI